MATVDQQDSDKNFKPEVYLKIWKWASGTWTLNSRIDGPHGGQPLTSIFFVPNKSPRTGLQLITSGLDGTLKTWGLTSTARQGDHTDGECGSSSESL
jgi:NET1-associated nuclear protein 1 (U3 small nucleolar RNA-associated protein 17)